MWWTTYRKEHKKQKELQLKLLQEKQKLLNSNALDELTKRKEKLFDRYCYKVESNCREDCVHFYHGYIYGLSHQSITLKFTPIKPTIVNPKCKLWSKP